MAKESIRAVTMTEGEEMEYGIHELVRHNAGTRYPQEQYALDDDGYTPSGSNSAYGTPEPGHMMFDQYGTGYNGSYVDHYDDRIANNMAYGSPMEYPNPTSGYYASPIPQATPYADYTVSSPPTPAASDQSSNDKRKRPTRPLVPTRSASHTSHSPRPKRNKQNKGEKSKVPKIDAPLSVLTKDFINIPVKDMDAWVNRSSEVRQVEVEKRKGKITRPMNSFMLYRSAYADRTKHWCVQNNHQVVSSVSGESWPMEPKEIRDLYTEYARIERDNHQRAHPGYKFSPSKAGAGNKKRRDMSEEEEEPSDLDDLDSEWRPSQSRGARVNGIKRSTPETAWQTGNPTYLNYGGATTSNAIQQSSAYQYHHPAKPLPIPMVNNNLYGDYYQTSVSANLSHPYTEDVFIRRENHMGSPYNSNTPLIGLPGGHHTDLMDEHSAVDTPAPSAEQQVDPYLLGHGEDEFGGMPTTAGHEQGLQGFNHSNFFGTDVGPLAYQDDPTLMHEMDSWQYGDPASPGTAIEDFDKWMGQPKAS